MNGALCVPGDVRLVGDQDDGPPLPVELAEEGHDLLARLGVQVPGGLIRHQDGRIGDQGPRGGHPLLLPARQFRRLVMRAVGEAHTGERGIRLRSDPALVPVDQREFHVLQGGGPGQQVEALEHEADLPVPNGREGVIVEPGHLLSIQQVGP